jgi:hypothetical protein
MLPTTYDALKSILRADPSISALQRSQFLNLVKTGPVPLAETPPKEPRLLRRAEVAARLSRSIRMVDKLAESGVLKKRKLPGRIRAAGFLESDVIALIGG